MWDAIMGRVPSGMVFVCALLTAVIPYCMYKLSDKLYKIGDPPWKKKKTE